VYELGFHLRPPYWRRGLAMEAASALITFAFGNLGAKALFAGHHPANSESHRILTKLGFRYTTTSPIPHPPPTTHLPPTTSALSQFPYRFTAAVLWRSVHSRPRIYTTAMENLPDAKSFLGMRAIIASPSMWQLLAFVERVAQTNASVLIAGESGSGKEVIARAIHHYSLRCSKAWVDVSCAALPEHLVESELFGYERGAFSGADSPKPGLFEMAHHGTLFLDEVGELEPRMQVKLLRVLDGASYYRLGGTRKVSVDVRIIAATNQDLEETVKNGRFRGDLFHRLGQINITVPPLRERPEDVIPIGKFFLQQQNPSLSFSPEAVAALLSHTWPGNVRELRNVVTKAAVLARSSEIAPSDLPFGLHLRAKANGPVPIDHAVVPNLDRIEKRTILDTLAKTNGHQQRAAEMLGISRRTLSRKLKLYGADIERQTCAS
jgi:transcriptional regulator with PAS, ATPase and Fis domain